MFISALAYSLESDFWISEKVPVFGQKVPGLWNCRKDCRTKSCNWPLLFRSIRRIPLHRHLSLHTFPAFASCFTRKNLSRFPPLRNEFGSALFSPNSHQSNSPATGIKTLLWLLWESGDSWRYPTHKPEMCSFGGTGSKFHQPNWCLTDPIRSEPAFYFRSRRESAQNALGTGICGECYQGVFGLSF